MKSRSFLMGMAVATMGIIFISYLVGRSKERRMLKQVADEGYETAHDILFPDKDAKSGLHYGPVLPADSRR